MNQGKVFSSLRKQDEARIKSYKQKKKKQKKKLLSAVIKKLPRLECNSMLRRMNYSEFLNSRYWKYVRGLVLKRDKHQCLICKSKNRLQVHHDTYKHHFDELNHLEDLLTLCYTCHKEHHYAQK